MRLAYLFVLLAVAATLDLPYQAHSFNDLDYFIQLVKKGSGCLNIRREDVQDGPLPSLQGQLPETLFVERIKEQLHKHRPVHQRDLLSGVQRRCLINTRLQLRLQYQRRVRGDADPQGRPALLQKIEHLHRDQLPILGQPE